MEKAFCCPNREAKATSVTCDFSLSSSKVTQLKYVDVWKIISNAVKIGNYDKIS